MTPRGPVRGLVFAALAAFGATALPARGEEAPAVTEVPPVPEPANVVLDPPLMGYRDGLYLRDERDNFRFYPQAQVDIDLRGAFGAGGLSEAQGAALGRPQLGLRRAKVTLAGDLFKHYNWSLGTEATGVPRLDASGLGAQGLCAGSPGERAPGRDAVRTDLCVRLTDTWLNVDFLPPVQVMVGQFRAPFSLENGTDASLLPWAERSLAVRGFATPNGEDVGLAVWGAAPHRYVQYAVGVFGGDGPGRSGMDGQMDVIGRAFVRPLNTQGPDHPRVQVGASVRYGQRDPKRVDYDLAPITTGQGFALWGPGYVDALGRETRVLPSGGDLALGLEWRVPHGRYALQGEVFYVSRDTRESVRGAESTNTERLGTLSGGAGYLQASAWIGDWFVTGEPGLGPRPTEVYLYLPPHSKRVGFEVATRLSGIFAVYEGASRGGERRVCARTGDAGSCAGTDLRLFELSASGTFWKERAFRFTVEGSVYFTPDSGTDQNLAGTPETLLHGADGSELVGEMSSRFGVTF